MFGLPSPRHTPTLPGRDTAGGILRARPTALYGAWLGLRFGTSLLVAQRRRAGLPDARHIAGLGFAGSVQFNHAPADALGRVAQPLGARPDVARGHVLAEAVVDERLQGEQRDNRHYRRP